MAYQYLITWHAGIQGPVQYKGVQYKAGVQDMTDQISRVEVG